MECLRESHRVCHPQRALVLESGSPFSGLRNVDADYRCFVASGGSACQVNVTFSTNR